MKIETVKELAYHLKEMANIRFENSATFEIHCDEFFARDFRNEFLSVGFAIPDGTQSPNWHELKKEPVNTITRYEIPMIGRLHIIIGEEGKFEIKLIK